MAYLTNNEVLRAFVTEIIGSGATSKRHTGGTLVSFPASPTDPNDRLVYHRRGGLRSIALGPITMCRYLADRKVFLVNGDGFTDNSATGWQTSLRNRLAQEIVTAVGDGDRNWRVLLVPFAALDGAEIQMSTVLPIQIREDTWDTIWHSVPDPVILPTEDPRNPQKWKVINETSTRRSYERTMKGVRFRRTATYESWRAEWRWIPQTDVMAATVDEPEPRWRPITQFHLASGTLHTRDALGRNVVRFMALSEHQDIVKENGERLAPEERIGWGWVEEVHHLGASVFSAVGEDGKRHKFVSAFDEAEPQPLYYLAQLPDRSGVTTYEEAIDALAPPIVKKAIEDGENPPRQGDIFAIRTDMSDEQVYKDARSRVRRSIAMFDLSTGLRRQMTENFAVPEPENGEVSETIDCPCRCGHRRRIGCGPKARNALSIYGTGHTADEVVVTRKGATFVRGTMYHDPQIHQPGRAAEHRRVQLGDDPKVWYLAVRNTVPRRKRRILQDETDTNGRR